MNIPHGSTRRTRFDARIAGLPVALAVGALILPAVLIAVPACSSTETSRAECGALVDHFLVLAHDAARDAARERLVDECVAMNLNATERACAGTAPDLDALAACHLPVRSPPAGPPGADPPSLSSPR